MLIRWFDYLASLALVFLLAGCTFDVSGIPLEGGRDAAPDGPIDSPPDAGIPDASSMDASNPPDGPGMPDAAPQVCTPNETYCDGDVLQTCDATGSGPIGDGEPCAFICDTVGGTAQCLYASNMPAEVYAACATSVPLTPTSGTVTIRSNAVSGGADIQCTSDCGNGSNTIESSHVVVGQAIWFCLSEVDIPAGMSVGYSGDIAEPIIWLVDGTVNIAGDVDLSGGDASDATGGRGGPGGHAGSNTTNGSGGVIGVGPCPGAGGVRVGGTGQGAGGGGGGGGFGGTGGTGGDGRSANGNNTAGGGDGGDSGDVCGFPELVPLVGGSSGGSGADSSCGGDCGWPSGGGGGALGIASRVSIDVSGSLVARGGVGYGEPVNGGGGSGGGGGGGAGGALLLQSRTLRITGSLVVDGGNGGQSAAGNGGPGASAGEIDGADGTSYMTPGDGGSGGGGGGGRIRLDTPDNAFSCGGFASPMDVCTSGSLPTVITPSP